MNKESYNINRNSLRGIKNYACKPNLKSTAITHVCFIKHLILLRNYMHCILLLTQPVNSIATIFALFYPLPLTSAGQICHHGSYANLFCNLNLNFILAVNHCWIICIFSILGSYANLFCKYFLLILIKLINTMLVNICYSHAFQFASHMRSNLQVTCVPILQFFVTVRMHSLSRK